MATPRVAVVVLALTGLLAAAPALSVSAQTQRQIEVFPGRHALAKALAEAMPGDALELHTGRYRDSVTVTTPNIVIELGAHGCDIARIIIPHIRVQQSIALRLQHGFRPTEQSRRALWLAQRR